MKKIKNILYIHGLEENKNSATCEKIRDLLPSCTIFSEDFDLYDVKDTLKKIDLFIEEQSIDKEAILEIACIHPDIQSVKISLNYNDVLQWKEPLQTFLESMKEVLPLHEVLKLIDKYKFSCATPCLRITEKRGLLTNGGGNLNYLIIPKNVSVIKKYALQNCRYVFVEIPLSLKKIEDGIFYNCRNLKDVYYEGTIEQWAEVKKGARWLFNTLVTTVHCSDGDAELEEKDTWE